MNTQRTKDGKYTKKSWLALFVRKILLVLVLIGVIYLINTFYTSYKNPQTELITQREDDGLTNEQRIRLERQAELARQETVLLNKKERLDRDYKSRSESLEVELQGIRKEKTNFQ